MLCLLLRSCPLDLSWTNDRNNSPVLPVQDQHGACQVTEEPLQPSKARPGTRWPTAKGVQLLAAALEMSSTHGPEGVLPLPMPSPLGTLRSFRGDRPYPWC